MNQHQRISSEPIAELMEQINTVIYSSDFARELKPAQWAALRFFSSAAINVRTVSGFAEMNCTTRGSASQTITTLVSKECLQRIPDEIDGRRHSLLVTSDGWKYLDRDPIIFLSEAITHLSSEHQLSLANIVTDLYQHVYINR